MSKPRVATITADGITMVVRFAFIRFLFCKKVPGKPTIRELTITFDDSDRPVNLTVSEEVAKTFVDCYSNENWE
jgi:hypothetical protein